MKLCYKPAVLTAALLLIAGCSGNPQFQEGRRLMAAGEHDRAVQSLRQAVALSPDNPQYFNALGNAETISGEKHMAQAEQLLAQHKTREAKGELQIALDRVPGDPKGILLMNRIDAELEPGVVRRISPPAAAAPPPVSSQKPVAVKPAPAPPIRKVKGPAPVASPAPTPAPASRPATPALNKGVVAEYPHAQPEPPATPPSAEPYRGTISRDDRRYPKEIEAIDGIIIKLKDTGKEPLRADIEIKVAKTSKTYRNLRIGARLNGRGSSKTPYQLIILAINHATETVVFSIEPLQTVQHHP